MKHRTIQISIVANRMRKVRMRTTLCSITNLMMEHGMMGILEVVSTFFRKFGLQRLE